MKTAEEHLEEAALNLGYGGIDEMLIVEPYSVVRSIVLSRMQTYADQFKNEWVSVKDRLPECGIEVLVWGLIGAGFEGLNLASYKTTGVWRSIIDGETVESVTHWQPLPSPPKTNKL